MPNFQPSDPLNGCGISHPGHTFGVSGEEAGRGSFDANIGSLVSSSGY